MSGLFRRHLVDLSVRNLTASESLVSGRNGLLLGKSQPRIAIAGRECRGLLPRGTRIRASPRAPPARLKRTRMQRPMITDIKLALTTAEVNDAEVNRQSLKQKIAILMD